MEEDKKIVKEIKKEFITKMKKDITHNDNQICYRNIQALQNILNELERLQKENNDLRAIKETVRYLEEAGVKDDLYYVVGRGSYLANVLENAQDFEKTVHTCLHCNENTPLYCENCYQELISKNAELQLENEELKNNKKVVANINIALDDMKEYIDGAINNILIENYIPKQAIRDKLEEVNKEYKKYTKKWEKSGMNKEHPFYRYIVRLEAQIDILKEILGDE